ncbi:MAG: hypothetical protein QOJ79_1976 [Actinomycetota bacterium]|jgi:hypothetical protein|nr:hypothetical protein [Actinomycetota bacterium]
MALTAVVPGRDVAPGRRITSLWRGPIGYCIRVFVVVRLSLFALGLLAVGLFTPGGTPGGIPGMAEAPLDGGWNQAITAWQRADALWYLRIAASGYRADDLSAAFFPLYPLLTRVVGLATGRHWLLAAYLVSNAAALVALVLLHRLTSLELSEAHARRVVVYVCVFPTGFFLFAPYTESLFLALSIGALYAARRHRWAAAAVLAALAAATRSPGILLVPALAVEAVLQARADPPEWRQLPWRLLAAASGALGLIAYLGYWQRYGGSWRVPLDVQKSGWDKQLSTPWGAVWGGVRRGLQAVGGYPGSYFVVDVLVVAVVLAAGVWVAMRMRPTYGVYLWASVLFPLLFTWPDRPLLSVPRIYLVVFPVYWALSRLAERWRLHNAVVGVSAGFMALLAAAFVGRYPLF